MKCTILALAGDGIGPEILGAGIDVANAVAAKSDLELDIKYDLIGGACWDKHKTFCQSETVSNAQNADAVLVLSLIHI